MSFSTEEELVRAFAATISSRRSSLPQMTLSFEFAFLGGKTDIIGVTGIGTVHSFEAKLKSWRKCLDQAYRSTSFSHYSYVVLPASIVDKAISHEHLFLVRGVGLCSMEDGKLRLHIRPKRHHPLQPWLTQRAVVSATEGTE